MYLEGASVIYWSQTEGEYYHKPLSFSTRGGPSRIPGQSRRTLEGMRTRMIVSSRRAVRPALCLLVLTLIAGCVHVGSPFRQYAIPPSAPPVDDILADLAANDGAIAGFRAAGAFIVETPEITKRRFQGRVVYQRPHDLSLRGNHPVLGTRIFEMECRGDAWVIDIPSENQRFAGHGAAEFDGVEGVSVTPFDIAREVFFQEDWEAVAPDQVEMLRYSPRTQSAVLVVTRPDGFRRRIEVAGAPWVVTRSSLYTPEGELLSEVERGEYREVDGFRVASRVVSTFPLNNASFEFRLRSIEIDGDPYDPDLGRATAVE